MWETLRCLLLFFLLTITHAALFEEEVNTLSNMPIRCKITRKKLNQQGKVPLFSIYLFTFFQISARLNQWLVIQFSKREKDEDSWCPFSESVYSLWFLASSDSIHPLSYPVRSSIQLLTPNLGSIYSKQMRIPLSSFYSLVKNRGDSGSSFHWSSFHWEKEGRRIEESLIEYDQLILSHPFDGYGKEQMINHWSIIIRGEGSIRWSRPNFTFRKTRENWVGVIGFWLVVNSIKWIEKHAKKFKKENEKEKRNHCRDPREELKLRRM